MLSQSCRTWPFSVRTSLYFFYLILSPIFFCTHCPNICSNHIHLPPLWTSLFIPHVLSATFKIFYFARVHVAPSYLGILSHPCSTNGDSAQELGLFSGECVGLPLERCSANCIGSPQVDGSSWEHLMCAVVPHSWHLAALRAKGMLPRHPAQRLPCICSPVCHLQWRKLVCSLIA